MIFRKPVSYDPEAKRLFHTHAWPQLLTLAAALGLGDGDYDLRSNAAPCGPPWKPPSALPMPEGAWVWKDAI